MIKNKSKRRHWHHSQFICHTVVHIALWDTVCMCSAVFANMHTTNSHDHAQQKCSMDVCWCEHRHDLNQSSSSRRTPVQFTVTINLSSEGFTEPNASHDPVGEGWVSHDRLQWFMQGKCMLGRHETHCGVAWSLIHHACARNN